ncbi:MAG TPA: DUF5996 family protein [Anaerolineales bacterium]|nr:DUF5996 family protein [Anaerolineales bacterium]
MTSFYVLPTLEDWSETKATLHAYSKVVGALSRTHAIAHPKWWHISLKVVPDGLMTDTMALPDGEIFALKMNMLAHSVELNVSNGSSYSWLMDQNWTASHLADQIFGTVESLGLKGKYARQKFANEEPRTYDHGHAERFFSILVNVEQAFRRHRAGLPGTVGPVQFWPHGFDLSFEWFGTRQIEFEEHGQKSTFLSQINLGFSPGESSHPEPYFYSNPFPFEREHLAHPLPHGARWFTEGWQGSLLEYASLAGSPDGLQKVADYAKAVFDLASPGLMV